MFPFLDILKVQRRFKNLEYLPGNQKVKKNSSEYLYKITKLKVTNFFPNSTIAVLKKSQCWWHLLGNILIVIWTIFFLFFMQNSWESYKLAKKMLINYAAIRSDVNLRHQFHQFRSRLPSERISTNVTRNKLENFPPTAKSMWHE